MGEDKPQQRRRWSDRNNEELPFEGRIQFRAKRTGESDTDYHLARVDAKVELSLRRSHQLHNAVSALFTQADLLHLGLLGDADLGAVGAIPALKNQITDLRANQERLPQQISGAIRDAQDDHDLRIYRGLRKWIIGAVGMLILTVLIVVTLVLLHLPTNVTGPT